MKLLRSKTGFTLLEMTTVILIIAVPGGNLLSGD